MRKHHLWRDEPPKASAEEWARAYECMIEIMPLDEEGDISEGDSLLHFILNDALNRCRLEAENRKPGILARRLDAALRED